MDQPRVAKKSPEVLELSPGKYFWCTCGGSASQPWCDGSHRGTAFRPKLLEITEAGEYALCCCKQTGQSPFCDGSHSAL